MSPEPPIKPPNVRRLKLFGAAAVILALAVGAGGLIIRANNMQSNVRWAHAQAVPTVTLAKVTTESSSQLSLPGLIQAFETAQIYARVSGYLKSWSQDIGARVKAGQVLATIDTPDLDQQYEQAKGELAMAKANQNLAILTAQRWSALLSSQAVSQQSVDQMVSDQAAKTAVTAAAQANVRHFAAMVAYKNVRAPFDGIVTARKTDIGALINAGSTGQELFEVSDLRRLRIYVQAPQVLSAKLAAGQAATFTVPQFPGRTFPATVTAVSHLMDLSSRTMQVQLQADNPDEVLAAGSYAEVTFQVPSSGNVLRVPATALIVTNSGDRVAVLGPNGRAVLKPVKLGRDYGDSVQVISGLQPADRVIDSPPETLRTGDAVQLAPATPARKGS